MDLPIEYEPYHRFVKRLPECSNQVWKEFADKFLPHSFIVNLTFDVGTGSDYIVLDKYSIMLSDWIRVHCTGVWSCDNIHVGYWQGGGVRFYFQDGKSAVLFKLKFHGA